MKNKLTAAQEAVLYSQNTTSSFAASLFSVSLTDVSVSCCHTSHCEAYPFFFFFFPFQGNHIIPKLKIERLEICGVLSVEGEE